MTGTITPVEPGPPPGEVPDDAVLARVRGGDPQALEELYDRFAGRVYSLAHSFCGDAAAAAEVTHDVFLDVWRRGDAVDAVQGSTANRLLTLAHDRAVARRRD